MSKAGVSVVALTCLRHDVLPSSVIVNNAPLQLQYMGSKDGHIVSVSLDLKDSLHSHTVKASTPKIPLGKSSPVQRVASSS